MGGGGGCREPRVRGEGGGGVVGAVVNWFCRLPGITYSLISCVQLIFFVFRSSGIAAQLLHGPRRRPHISSLSLSNNTTTFLTYSCIWIKLL